MKYIFDHSKDKVFEEAGLEPAYKREWELFYAFRPKLSAHPFKEERVHLFYELATQLDATACMQGARLEVTVKEDYPLAELAWSGWNFEVFRVDDGPAKAALSLGLQKVNSVHFRIKDKKLEILMFINLWN